VRVESLRSGGYAAETTLPKPLGLDKRSCCFHLFCRCQSPPSAQWLCRHAAEALPSTPFEVSNERGRAARKQPVEALAGTSGQRATAELRQAVQPDDAGGGERCCGSQHARHPTLHPSRARRTRI